MWPFTGVVYSESGVIWCKRFDNVLSQPQYSKHRLSKTSSPARVHLAELDRIFVAFKLATSLPAYVVRCLALSNNMGHYIGSRPRCFLSLHCVRSLSWRKCYQESDTTIWTGTRLLLWCHPSTQVQQICQSQIMRRSNCLRCLHITWLLSHGGELGIKPLSTIIKAI